MSSVLFITVQREQENRKNNCTARAMKVNECVRGCLQLSKCYALANPQITPHSSTLWRARLGLVEYVRGQYARNWRKYIVSLPHKCSTYCDRHVLLTKHRGGNCSLILNFPITSPSPWKITFWSSHLFLARLVWIWISREPRIFTYLFSVWSKVRGILLQNTFKLDLQTVACK